MSHLQGSVSLSTDKEASPLDYGALDMPDLPRHPSSQAQPIRSLELLASTPTTQYYGPEIPQSDVLPRSPLNAVWDGRQSFQQAHQSLIGGQEPDQQPCYSTASSSSAQSPSMVPLYTHLNYHDHALPEDPSAVEDSNSQVQVVEPTLKRQRNTAASARFRAKKKRNDEIQARNAREREGVINRLENRVTELETENRWLKDLLIDKAEANVRKTSRVIADDRKGSEHKDGVGTSSA
ncbi:Regulatory cys-3 [Hyphodiscus hymeniophilus]|uniref:Regulatory cys-3 n=1 Tax=Hyphodiscus hymeniophilus TaxID=353542 RepID=A0A9P6VEM8_9HELO|nr:Regulatory cys-3 [Hyphodiscus hymeniophilus]